MYFKKQVDRDKDGVQQVQLIMEMGRQRPQNLFPDPCRLEDMFYEWKPLCPSEEVTTINYSFTIIDPEDPDNVEQ